MAATYTEGQRWRYVVDDPINVSGTNTGTTLSVEAYDLISCQLKVTTTGVGTATMYLQGSINGTDFDNIAGATVDLAMAAANTGTITLSRRAFAKIRAACTVAATSGQITAYFIFKKED